MEWAVFVVSNKRKTFQSIVSCSQHLAVRQASRRAEVNRAAASDFSHGRAPNF